MKLPFEKINREVLIKKEANTNTEYGVNPEERPIEELIKFGVINLDKPAGPTSHEVSAFVQKILSVNKSGQSGTLDPGVTGVLPIAIGRATKVVQTLLKAGKEYHGVMHLHKDVSDEDLKKAVKKFTGKIKQLPPVKSAIRRQLRWREVYYFDILERDGKEVLFRTGVEAGTYIRKLIYDMGRGIGGANMAELRRTKAGPFNDNDLITLHDLTDAYWFWKNEDNEKYIRKCIKPTEFAVQHIAKIWVPDNVVDSICHGIDLKIPGISKLNSKIKEKELVAIMSLKDELIALGYTKMNSEQMMKENKGIAVSTHKVFMEINTYPRIK